MYCRWVFLRDVEEKSKVFFTVQNNELYNIAEYLCFIRALFVLYFVQLDNKAFYRRYVSSHLPSHGFAEVEAYL